MSIILIHITIPPRLATKLQHMTCSILTFIPCLPVFLYITFLERKLYKTIYSLEVILVFSKNLYKTKLPWLFNTI